MNGDILVNTAHDISKGVRTGDVLLNEDVDFAGLHLSGAVLEGLHSAGFKRPSPIQLKAIPIGRCGLDLIVQAKSGTGKTCVFTVVALESLDLQSNSTQVLVIAPTREIAVQIQDVFKSIGAGLTGLICHTFIGGLPVSEDKAKLKKCHIAVGTPGRLRQLVEHGALKPETIRLLILDEADKLMEDGFQEQINWMYSVLPQSKQMLALSATYPEVLAQHLTTYMRNPSMVRLNSSDPALLGIRQYFKLVEHHPVAQKAFDYKVEALLELLTSITFNQCLVFSNYQMRAESLSDVLNAKGWPATFIGGMLDQTDRLAAMESLRALKCRVLISTDLTSRGIDAENVNLVINLDIPKDHETYLHRIGRAGRFGTYGAGITLASIGKGEEALKDIESKCNTCIKPLPDPIPNDLAHSSGYVYLGDLVTTEKLITASQSEDIKTAANVSDNDSAVGSYPRQDINGDVNVTDDDVFYENKNCVGDDEGIVDDVEEVFVAEVKGQVDDVIDDPSVEKFSGIQMLDQAKVEIVHYSREDRRLIGQVKCDDCHTYSYIAVLDPEAELEQETIHKCAYSEEFPSLSSGDESDNDRDISSLQGTSLKTYTLRGLGKLSEETCNKCFPEEPLTVTGESIIEEEDFEIDDTATECTETESEFDGPEPEPARPGALMPAGYWLQYDRETLLRLSYKPCHDCSKYSFSDFIDPIWKNGQPHKKYNPFNCKHAVRRKKSRTTSESYDGSNVRKTPPKQSKSRSMSVGSQQDKAKTQPRKISCNELDPAILYELDPAIVSLISKVPEWNAPNVEAIPEVNYDDLYLTANGSTTPPQRQFTSYEEMLQEMMKKGEEEKKAKQPDKNATSKGKAKGKASPVNGGGDAKATANQNEAKLKLKASLPKIPTKATVPRKPSQGSSEPIGVPAGGNLPSPSEAMAAKGMKPSLIINYYKADKKSRSSSHSTYPFGEDSLDVADVSVISNNVSDENIGEILGATANSVTTQINQEYADYDESFLFFENQDKSLQIDSTDDLKNKKKKKKKSNTNTPADKTSKAPHPNEEKTSKAPRPNEEKTSKAPRPNEQKTSKAPRPNHNEKKRADSESFQFIPDNSTKNKNKNSSRKSSSSSTTSSLYSAPRNQPPPYGYPPGYYYPSMQGGFPNTSMPPPPPPPPSYLDESQGYYHMQYRMHEAYMRHFRAMYQKCHGKKTMLDELSLQNNYISYMSNISRMLQLK